MFYSPTTSLISGAIRTTTCLFHLLFPVFRRKERAELRPAAQKPLVLRRRPHHLMGAADGERQTNKTVVTE